MIKIIVSKKVSHFMTKYVKLFINVQVHSQWKSFLDTFFNLTDLWTVYLFNIIFISTSYVLNQ